MIVAQTTFLTKFISDLILWHSGRFPWWIVIFPSITSRICQIVASFILISIISNSTVFYKIHINRFRLGKDYFYIKNCAYCEIIRSTIMLLMEICSGSIAHGPYHYMSYIAYIGWGQNKSLSDRESEIWPNWIWGRYFSAYHPRFDFYGITNIFTAKFYLFRNRPPNTCERSVLANPILM